MSTAGSPRPSATSIVARRPSKDEITGWQDRPHSPHDDAVGRGGGLTASRPPGLVFVPPNFFVNCQFWQ